MAEGEWRTITVEEAIQRLVDKGLSDEEVLQFLEGSRRQWWGDERKRLTKVIHDARGASTEKDRLAELEAFVASIWTGDVAPTMAVAAEKRGVTDRWISEIARSGGGWKALLARVGAGRK